MRFAAPLFAGDRVATGFSWDWASGVKILRFSEGVSVPRTPLIYSCARPVQKHCPRLQHDSRIGP